jgi:diguanylate cyclase (GGDEF)-like protein
LKCGADNFISKPFDEVRLVSQINHIFDNLKLIGQDRSDSWIQVTISGETNLIELNPVRMISFLIYSYETAIEQNTELRKISNELRYLSTHDFVTGLYNRTYFEEELKRLSLGREYPVSIIVADVDGLKTVNDSLGHAAGDSLLRLVSDILSESFRIGDVVARIGGDEFGVLLHNAGSEVVVDSIKRVRAKLKAIKVEDVGFCVSVSIGSTTAYTSDQMASALKLSDERMYIEKMIHKKNGYDVFVLV